MADVDFDDFDGAYDQAWTGATSRSGRVSRIVHLAGAACSVALVIGLGWWGYKLAVRDVTGVPVVRALEGPMRIAPENPGGEIADHQGLAVNTVAALGTAAPPPDRLVLAPRPVELTYEDTPGLAALNAAPEQPFQASAAAPLSLAPQPAPVIAPSAAPLTAAVEPSVPAPQEDMLGPDPDAVAQALAEALAAPMDEIPEETIAETEADTDSGIVRPRQRPAAAGTEVASLAPVTLAEPTATVAAGTTEVDPSLIPAGTRLVQLGAFDTADQARAEWVKLANQFGTLMDGKALVVQAAESGGRTFYRLRAHGFADETEARGFCTTMLEQNASCIPVEQR